MRLWHKPFDEQFERFHGEESEYVEKALRKNLGRPSDVISWYRGRLCHEWFFAEPGEKKPTSVTEALKVPFLLWLSEQKYGSVTILRSLCDLLRHLLREWSMSFPLFNLPDWHDAALCAQKYYNVSAFLLLGHLSQCSRKVIKDTCLGDWDDDEIFLLEDGGIPDDLELYKTLRISLCLEANVLIQHVKSGFHDLPSLTAHIMRDAFGSDVALGWIIDWMERHSHSEQGARDEKFLQIVRDFHFHLDKRNTKSAHSHTLNHRSPKSAMSTTTHTPQKPKSAIPLPVKMSSLY